MPLIQEQDDLVINSPTPQDAQRNEFVIGDCLQTTNDIEAQNIWPASRGNMMRFGSGKSRKSGKIIRRECEGIIIHWHHLHQPVVVDQDEFLAMFLDRVRSWKVLGACSNFLQAFIKCFENASRQSEVRHTVQDTHARCHEAFVHPYIAIAKVAQGNSRPNETLIEFSAGPRYSVHNSSQTS